MAVVDVEAGAGGGLPKVKSEAASASISLKPLLFMADGLVCFEEGWEDRAAASKEGGVGLEMLGEVGWMGQGR